MVSYLRNLKYNTNETEAACSVMSHSLCCHGPQPARLLCPWDLSWQEYWSGLPFPSPGDCSDLGIESASSTSPALQAESLPLSHPKRYRLIDIENRFVVATGEERRGRDGVQVWD